MFNCVCKCTCEYMYKKEKNSLFDNLFIIKMINIIMINNIIILKRI